MILLLIFTLSLSSLLFGIYILKKGKYATAFMPFFYVFISIYTYFGAITLDYAKVVPNALAESINSNDIEMACIVILLFAFFFSLSASFFSIREKNVEKKNFGQGISPLYFKIIEPVRRKLGSKSLFIISLVSPLVLALSYGVSDVLYREGYLGSSRFMFGMLIARITLPISCICMALLPSRSRFLSAALNYLLLFSITSRAMLFIPLFLLLSRYLNKGRFGFWYFLTIFIVLIISMGVALEFRYNEFQGLIPNFLLLINEGVSFEYIQLGLNYVTSYSVFLLAYMMKYVGNYDPNLFWAAVNPLPSFVYDIGDIMENAKIREYIPYSAIGELYLMGMNYLIVIALIIGGVFSRMESFLMKKATVFSVIGTGFIIMFSLMSTQYQLRGSFRLVIYVVAICFFIKAVSVLNYTIFLHKRK